MERRVNTKHFLLRVLIFFFGLVVLSLGIDLNTKTQLGISPINSVPFNVHKLTGLPLWMCVYAFYLVFILMQWLLLKKDFHPIQCFQLVTSFVNSLLIQFFDDSIPLLTEPVSQYLVLVLAIVLTAAGISLTAGMKLIPNPGEGVAGAIGIALKKDFGYGKNVLDLGCVALSIAITLIFAGRISNIGIGTVLSMLVTGRIVKLFSAPTGKLYEKIS